MPTTANNLDRTLLVTGQADPETTGNDQIGELDSFLTAILSKSVAAGNVLLTALEYRRYRKVKVTGNTTAGRSLTLQAIPRQVLIDNSDVANTQAIAIKLGSTTLSLPVGKKGIYETDGAANGLELVVSNDISGLDLSAYAPLASPTFTGTPAVPTAAPGTNTTQASSTAFVKAAIDVVLGGVSAAFDTLSEIATALAGKLVAANNLSDLVSASTARANLGCGTIATFAETTAAQYLANTTGKALSTDKVWSAADLVTLTDAATIAVDMSTLIHATVTLAGGRTLGNPTNTKNGQAGVIYVVQDGTGGRTLAYAGNYKFEGGTAPVLSTGAGKVDRLNYIVRSSTHIDIDISKDRR
jgi:hypothetical protein